MHLLIVSQYFWPEEFRINDLASELVSRGHEVTVLTGKPNYPMGQTFPAFKETPDAYNQYNGVNIVRVPLVPRGHGALRLALNYFSFALSASLIGTWKLRKVNFDVIFSPQLSPITAMLPAVILRQIRRRKFVMWVLDLWPDTLRALGVVKSQYGLKCIGKFCGYIYHRVDKLFVQSQGFIPNIEKYTTRPVEIEYLPNWSETMPDMSKVEPSRQVQTKAHEFNIMFAGALGESQDFPAVLEAMEKLRDIPELEWRIVGDGRIFDWLNAEVERRGLHNVSLYGRHPVEDMPAFYKHANAMLVCLRADPIFAMTVPGKIQSYLAAGKPIIAMLDGEGAKVIRDSGAGYSVPAGDFEGLVNAVRRMIALNKGQLTVMGEAAKRYSDSEFDRTVLIDRIEKTLQDYANDLAKKK